jgi:hypothetical protein
MITPGMKEQVKKLDPVKSGSAAKEKKLPSFSATIVFGAVTEILKLPHCHPANATIKSYFKHHRTAPGGVSCLVPS